MKKHISLIIGIILPFFIAKAGNYTVEVGSTETIYCTVSSPSGGWIDVCNWTVVNASDAAYVSITNHSRDLYATITGLQTKANIQVEVVYSYSWPDANNTIHVGNASYYDYITVTGGVSPTSVSISPSSITIGVGKTTTLTASVTPSNANTSYSWGVVSGMGTPSNFTLTPLGNTATIKANAAGTAYVVVETSNGKQAICTVVAQSVDATDISITAISGDINSAGWDSYIMAVGKSASLKAELTPSDATSTVSWATSSSSIVSVADLGKMASIKAKAAGTATITARTSNGVTASIEIEVSNYVVATDISLTPSSLNMAIGDQETITYNLTPYNANSSVTWKSSSPSIASVGTTSGKVTAKAVGTATITATTDNNISATCTVVVSDVPSGPTSISLSPTSMTLNVGDYQYIYETFYPEGTTADITWSSSNTSVATVSSAGKVTAVSAGTATITAKTSNNKSATCSVTVTAATTTQPTSISLSPTSMSLEVGAYKYIYAIFYPEGTSADITWSSSNTSVADVSLYGKVTAVSAGTATITAKTSNNKTATCSVAVAGGDETISGMCGDNLTWNLLDSVLTISGTGTMKDYSSSSTAPWYSYRAFIKTVIIQSGITSIGNYAFYGCTSSTSVTIPKGITSIGSYAFFNCNELTSISIPNGVVSIGDKAFYYCFNLTSVSIPNSVTSIGSNVFDGHNNLSSVMNYAKAPQSISYSTFYYLNYSQSTLYVPETSIGAYRSASYWKDFKSIQPISLVTYRIAYMEYQMSLINMCDAMKKNSDGDDIQLLIDNAKLSIMKRSYNDTLTYMENEAELDSIVEQLQEMIITCRAKYKVEYSNYQDSLIIICNMMIKEDDDYTVYMLVAQAEIDIMSRIYDEELTLDANKAALDDIVEQLYKKILEIRGDNEEGIVNILIPNMNTPCKVLYGHQIFIIRNGNTYTITGQEVR